ncbi:PqqD family protein [Microbacterium sp. SA39]|uniref:PqqD family protein n=1 Tax=Microbacterium sp. SA39 TaxID=1263625 RepID=UPI000620131E|nr:PqqD family peptide modification chaperone [Microbacterium sp. SA39]KJQ55069.1 hypothetical protein RS85_01128 [Microbacterium sp. SA39]
MPDRFLVDAVGAVIEVDASLRDVQFQDRARGAWIDALRVGDHAADAVVAVREGLDDDAALSMLSTDVTIAALAHRRHDPVWMLHAAGLADESGRVVVLSAASGTGKTTAARYLSRRYAYVSDETVAIAADGRVDPYRKPLSIIEPDSAHKAQVAPSRLGAGHPLPPTLRVVKIVVIDRSPDAPELPTIEQLDVGEALELLGPQTSYLCDGAAPLQRIDALLAATGGAVRLRYREVTGIDAIIDDLMATEIRPVRDTSTHIGERAGAPADASLRPGTFDRGEAVDSLDLGDRRAVLRRTPTGGQVHVLDGIGPTIWSAAQGATLDELVDAVIAEHGEPEHGDARAMVRAAVQELVDDGILQAAPAQT